MSEVSSFALLSAIENSASSAIACTPFVPAGAATRWGVAQGSDADADPAGRALCVPVVAVVVATAAAVALVAVRGAGVWCAAVEASVLRGVAATETPLALTAVDTRLLAEGVLW